MQSTNKNNLLLAAAGSGKTTYLVNRALEEQGRVLITTYTEANEREIRNKIIEKQGCIPPNIFVQTWFSFLLEHCVRPYQGVLYNKTITGMILVNSSSGVKYRNTNGISVLYRETETENYYFASDQRIYSDKISKFAIKCNERTQGAVISRLTQIYQSIYVDEVQDMAGHDLDLLKLLFESQTPILLVGDPRQVVYLTHHPKRLKKYSNGKIKDFVVEECKKLAIAIDDETLKYSHRNNASICTFSSKLYPEFVSSEPCNCPNCRANSPDEGIYLVREKHIQAYIEKYNPMQLKLHKNSKGVLKTFPALNFGQSKGQTFERVLIFPTKDMKKWVANNNQKLTEKTRAQFYVAITRARKSIGIVIEDNEAISSPDATLFELTS